MTQTLLYNDEYRCQIVLRTGIFHKMKFRFIKIMYHQKSQCHSHSTENTKVAQNVKVELRTFSKHSKLSKSSQ